MAFQIPKITELPQCQVSVEKPPKPSASSSAPPRHHRSHLKPVSLPLLTRRGGCGSPDLREADCTRLGHWWEQSRGRGQCGLLSAGPGHGEGRKAWALSGDIKVHPMRQYSHVQILTFSILSGHICCITGKRCVHRLGNQHSP